MFPKVLIFDVDGTLADTEEAHRRSFNQTFDHFGLGWHWSASDYQRLLAVTGGKERIAAHLDSLALPADERAPLQSAIAQWHADKTVRYAQMVAGGAVPLRPGVAQLLAEARAAGVRLAIATTTTRANIDALLSAHLGAHAADTFEVIACGDMVLAKKPAPDVYELALRTLGVDPPQAIAFEDSVAGLSSAVGAGLWTVVTPTCWTEGGDFSTAAVVMSDLAALAAGDPILQTLARLWSGARTADSPENRGLPASTPSARDTAAAARC